MSLFEKFVANGKIQDQQQIRAIRQANQRIGKLEVEVNQHTQQARNYAVQAGTEKNLDIANLSKFHCQQASEKNIKALGMNLNMQIKLATLIHYSQ